MKVNQILQLALLYSTLFGITSKSYASCMNVCQCMEYTCRTSNNSKTLIQVKYFDKDLLNLVSKKQNIVASNNSAITITQADYQNITSPGNTWVEFQKFDISFGMNIGNANATTPQTFTLPNNLLTFFSSYGRKDFVSESSIPVELQISGADVAAKSYFLEDDHYAEKYYHVAIEPDGVMVLGSSYDFYEDADDNFSAEPDYEFLDAPMALNDQFETIYEEIDFNTNVCLEQKKEIKTVNGYGNLVLPNGVSVPCLRIGVTTEVRNRENPTQSFPNQPNSTKNGIIFVTKEGHFFQADISSGTSGNVTLTNIAFRFIAPTSSLNSQNAVKINNSSLGVAINSTDDSPDANAVLDVQSENKGILIPRILKINRPTAPTEGLLIYQIDDTPGFYYYDGTTWQKLSSTTSPSMNAMVESKPRLGGRTSLKNGSAFVKFDRPIDDFEQKNITVQAIGDCKGLYISNITKEGFEVKELQKGKSNILFSWQIN